MTLEKMIVVEKGTVPGKFLARCSSFPGSSSYS